MAEGLMLSLPAAAPSALAALGPRPNAAVLARLRRIVCPTSAAALMLALATDAEARCPQDVRRGGSPPTATRSGSFPAPIASRHEPGRCWARRSSPTTTSPGTPSCLTAAADCSSTSAWPTWSTSGQGEQGRSRSGPASLSSCAGAG